MGRDLQLRCGVCAWSRGFSFGCGALYNQPELLLSSLRPAHEQHRVRELMRRADFVSCGMAENIYQCAACQNLFNERGWTVRYGTETYVVPRHCARCGGVAREIAVDLDDMRSELAACPKCRNIGLDLSCEAFWD